MSAAQLLYLRDRLRSLETRTEQNGSHLIYLPRVGRMGHSASDNGRGYVTVRLTIPGIKSKSMLVSRAVYICRTARLDLYPGNGMSDWHVSHTCHRRLCIHPDHLVLEPGHINQGRHSCATEKRCSKNHNGYPPCVFD